MATTTENRLRPVGVVLAGGLSRRLGRDKATLELAGVSLAERAAARLAAVGCEVAIADRGRRTVPGLPSLPDGDGDGPAAGILGAAGAYPGRALVVLACDLPAVPGSLLAALAESAEPHGGGELIMPRHRDSEGRVRIEPLCARYGPAALAALAEQVAGGELALHRLAERPELPVTYLESEALARHGDPAELFVNLNTPQELARWLDRRAGGPGETGSG